MIVLLTNEFRPGGGGIATYCHDFALALHRRKRQIEVICPRAGRPTAEHDSSLPFPVHRAPEPPLAVLRWAARARVLGRVLARRTPDLLWTSDWRTGMAAVPWARRRGLPLLVTAHGSEVMPERLSGLDRRIARAVLSRADAVGADSHFTARRVAELGIDPSRIHVVRLGVDPAPLQRAARGSGQVRRRHGLGDAPVLLTLARLTPRKGQDVVIRALPRLLRRHPDLVYLVAGGGEDEDRLRRLAADTGVADRVIFAGRVPEEEKGAYYAACDVYVMLSRQEGHLVEGFGLTLLEAAACGLPVVAGDHGGTSDAMVPGKTGLLVDPLDAAAAADILGRLLADADLRRSLGAAGRRHAEGPASIDRVTGGLIELMDGIRR